MDAELLRLEGGLRALEMTDFVTADMINRWLDGTQQEDLPTHRTKMKQAGGL